MSIWTIIFLVIVGLCMFGWSALYRDDVRNKNRKPTFDDIASAVFVSALITGFVMLISGFVLAMVADGKEGEIVDTYKAELIPMVDEDQELLTVDDELYVFSYLRENGSPVKEEVWYPDVTIIDYNGEPYMVKEQWMGPDNYFPWEWQRWDDTRYVIYTDAETAPLVAQ